MHELQLTKQIVDIALKHTQESSAQKVVKVILSVGTLSGVVPEALDFCFGICAKNTLLEGADLVIERIPSLGLCKGCEKKFDLIENKFSCPGCSRGHWEILSGKELSIKELEVV